MKKKKVTAPLTYDPGKGRPKEHLAYLNWQEMQALKRLNGNNQERGPKGLPSFPPADAAGSSSKAGSKSTGARGPTGPQGQARSSPAGNKGGAPGSVSRTGGGARGPTGPQGQQRTSPAGVGGGGRGVGANVGAGRQGGGTRSLAGDTRPSNVVSGGRTGFSGAGQNAVDAKVKAEAAKRDAVKISRESPAYKADTAKKGIGSLGFSQQFEKQPGGKVKGAISAQKEQMYQTAPRYNQPQTQRIQNPTAIPSMERTSYERMQMAEAARQRAAKAAQQVARTGPFGPQSYTGTYNPKTGRYDARPVAATSPVAMDPGIAARLNPAKYGPALSKDIAMDASIPGRAAQANKNYTTVTGPGGMVSSTYADPDVPGRTLGDVVTDYGKYAYDTVGGYLTAVGDYLGLPDRPVMPSGDVAMRMANEALMANPPRPAKPIQDRIAPSLPPRQFVDRVAATPTRVYDQPNLANEIARANAQMENIAGQIRTEQLGPRYNAEETLRAYEAQKRAATPAPRNETIIGPENYRPPDRANQAAVDAANRMRYNTSPATVSRLKDAFATAEYDKTINKPGVQGKAEPMGYEMPGEKFLSVENVLESTSSFVGMSDSEIKKTLKDLGYPSKIYNNPKFARDFIEDPDRLGVVGTGNRKLDPVSMAKLHSEAYGSNYLTPAERAQAAVSSGIERVVTRNPFAKAATKTFKELRDIESPKEFLSRPQYEQDYLRGLAKAEAIQYGRSPFADGDRRGGGDRSGIASLSAPKLTETVAPTPTDSTTGTTTKFGPRPEIYYYWDLGVNIPSPTDPNYTQYQTYLRERAAAQAAMYG